MSLNGARHEPVVAVDAMGGDHAPDEVIKGAVDAHRRGANVVLVGPRDVLGHLLSELGADLPIVHAPEVIAMDEAVGLALHRRESSLRLATELVTQDEADAVVSCGNSAAIMAVALRCWGRQPGIERPAFGAMIPNRGGGVFVLDVGANAEVKPSNLVQFAIMGDVYLRLYRGIDSPRVALLSNGSEDSKGTKVVKEANEAIRKLDLNFVGNVEGNHIFDDITDVLVCDGFSGNVLLKVGEGVAMEMVELLRTELSRDLLSKLAAAALMPSFERIKRRVDYEEYGGVPVLGVNGVMINCHGRSKARAVTNAIFVGERMARERLIERISSALHAEEREAGRRRRLARALHLRHGET